MRLSVILFIAIMPLLSGKPVNDAKIYLEKTSRELIAYQQTGQSGKVLFKYLDAGSYSILMELPQQEGKWIRERGRNSVLTKAAFNIKDKTYYYQGVEGYFEVKIKGLRKSEYESFNPVFREIRGDGQTRILLGQIRAANSNAKISLSVKAITDSQFKKAVEKTNNDLSLMSIPGVR